MDPYEQIFEAICADPRYLENLDWGEPRSGHPEGTVRAHIAEFEKNLKALALTLSACDCWKLKVLAHTHVETVQVRRLRPGLVLNLARHQPSLASRRSSAQIDDAARS